VSFADDIVVLDSLEHRRHARRRRRSRGARWFERAYDGRGPHQNWAMEHIDFKHRWVFYLDADERMTPELRAEIEKIADAWDSGRDVERDRTPSRTTAGAGTTSVTWLKHAMPPGNIMRFFQPPLIRFAAPRQPRAHRRSGRSGISSEHVHSPQLQQGAPTSGCERHNRYSTYEAVETVNALANRPVRLGNLFHGDRTTRRLELKNLSFRMPARAVLKFLYMYILQRGFLDGRAGFAYCLLQGMYEEMIVLKVHEIQRKNRGLSPS
jgi:hypothetical protein